MLLGLGAVFPAAGAEVGGRVVDANGPVAGAVVRVQTTLTTVRTDETGRFLLPVDGLGPAPWPLTGWARGYFCTGPVSAHASDTALSIELAPHPGRDYADYQWLSAEHGSGEGEDKACKACHSRGQDLDLSLPFEQWRLDAHSASARNPRFLSLYSGTDLAGHPSPTTRTFTEKDYGTFPLPPDPEAAYYGPGYKLDFPGTAGNCAACHVPLAAVDRPHQGDAATATGVSAEGVNCDFCHKVWDVVLDPDSGLPYPDRPGVMSFELRRPPHGHQFFAGPFDDVAPGEDTYSPLQRDGRFCAPCHSGTFWGTVIYDSFGEWLRSPYSDPERGQTCQDCHMPDTGDDYFARPDQGGLLRPHTPLHSHRMPGATDRELLGAALSMRLEVVAEGDELGVRVMLRNHGAGHHVPTDSPLRHLILRVEAKDADGEQLLQRSGSVLPAWVAGGELAEHDYAGLPGVVYAKLLEEQWTRLSPTGAYWNPVRIVGDNRIAACSTVSSEFRFHRPERVATLEATLVLRRAFRELMQQKGWQVPDQSMAQARVVVAPGAEVSLSSGTLRPLIGPCAGAQGME